MRARCAVPYAVLIGVLCVCSVTSEPHAVQPRQNNDASQSLSTTQTSAISTASSSETSQSSDNVRSTSASTSEGSSASPASRQGTSSASATDSSMGTATPSNPTSSSPGSTSSIATSITPSASATATDNDLPPSAYKGNLYTDPTTLPIPPRITPALSIAGVLMMIAGTVYALIGIKNRLLHIFLSAVLLTSLAVTVLIVYVMNPPVNNAVQGAYFVAALVTGVIFGVGSIIFTEVTEGLGCLLGGFCLSMWFLVLKPGGLLHSTTQKAIFIAAFSLVVYALSFSRYTRPYGLIGSTSFAGATVVVLGIDCFSRAGLKEFWLYLWSLNSNLFPLGTTTYPITRGIRVEIASIVLFFLLGIVSQSKLWKVIKERRERKAAERHEREVQREREEEDLGRQLEEGNYRERAQWEAIYGDRDKGKFDQADSGIGTEAPDSRKVSTSIIDTKDVGYSTAENIEMNDLNDSKRLSHGEPAAKRTSKARHCNTPTVMVVHDDDQIDEVEANGEGIDGRQQQRYSKTSMRSCTPDGFLEVPIHGQSAAGNPTNKNKSRLSSGQKNFSAAPQVIPLPFTIPVAEDSNSESDDRSSVLTIAESGHREESHGKRLSGRSILKRLSGRSLVGPSQSEEALVVPHVEDDQASSIAATVDDEDGDELGSTKPTRSDDGSNVDQFQADKPNRMNSTHLPELPNFSAFNDIEPMTDMLHTSNAYTDNTPSGGPDEARPSLMATNNFDSSNSSDLPPVHSSGKASKISTQRTSLTSSTDPKKDDHVDRLDNTQPRRRSNIASETQQAAATEARPKSTKSIAPSEASEKRSSRASFSEQLPSKLSKVVMSYRTNEWAKHLDRAEKPNLDDLKLVENSADQGTEDLEETAAPVNVAELRQTAFDAQPGPPTSQISSQGYQQASALDRSASRTSLQDQQLNRTPYGLTPQITPSPSSQSLLTPGGLQQPLSLNTRGLRSSSTPLTSQPLVESPLEGGLESNYPTRYTPSPIPSNTLLAKRDHIVRNRYSSLPFTTSPADSSVQLTPNDSASVRHCRLNSLDDDDDNMSLSQRRSLIQLQRQLQNSSPHLSQQAQAFDSHQPQRCSVTPNPDRREAMLASWRQSVRQELALNQQPNFSVDARRQDLMVDKHQSSLNQQQQAMAVNHRDSVFDQAMRRGDMLELHKEAIRKMQASANKHV